MDSTFKPPTTATTPHRPSKRLLFDRRYGLVIDEWEDPSEVALAGGRGMFCIVPLGKALFEKASESINLSASCIINVLQNPDKLSPDRLRAVLSDHYHEFASSEQNVVVIMCRRYDETEKKLYAAESMIENIEGRLRTTTRMAYENRVMV